MKRIFRFIIALLFILLLCFGINFLLTKLIIWLSNGLFNYPLDDKFWYIFVLLLIIQVVFNKGGKK